MKMAESTARCWVDLPHDLLVMITSHLLSRDRGGFRCVCKTWESVISPPPPPPVTSTSDLNSNVLSNMIKFPLLMFSGSNTSLCNFYHPLYSSTFVVDIPEITNACKILFSKDGWLLMSRDDHEMLFFNPLTNQVIDLPDYVSSCNNFTGMCFSSVPTSQDCIVFGVQCGWEDQIDLTFIRHGDDEWTSWRADNNLDFLPSHSNPVFHKGRFYYLGKNGMLGVYDPNQEGSSSWTILPQPKQPCNSIKRSYLTECNGDLISVFQGNDGTWMKIFKLYPATMTWRKVESLGDQMLFVNRTVSMSAASTNEAPGMQNKIYLPMFYRSGCVFYSLFTNKFHTYETGFNNDDLYNATEKMNCIWIEPNLDIYTEEELQWYEYNSEDDSEDSEDDDDSEDEHS